MSDKQKLCEGLEKFIKDYEIQKEGEYLVFYKTVSKEYGSLWMRRRLGMETWRGATIRERGVKNVYIVNRTVQTNDYSVNRRNRCGKGVHICTLEEAKEYKKCIYFNCYDRGRKIMKVLVKPEDIVCVPFHNNGKIRAKKIYVVGEIKK